MRMVAPANNPSPISRRSVAPRPSGEVLHATRRTTAWNICSMSTSRADCSRVSDGAVGPGMTVGGIPAASDRCSGSSQFVSGSAGAMARRSPDSESRSSRGSRCSARVRSGHRREARSSGGSFGGSTPARWRDPSAGSARGRSHAAKRGPACAAGCGDETEGRWELQDRVLTFVNRPAAALVAYNSTEAAK